ncbi:unnamed protein product (macronuclear) [Paramecium tetraurelia]|uniref:Serine aminopeptidase S33 domain-containing protein n=1 Tax=Paramecium tetraurelia TaxID=5888 RepID=A0E4I4_PARTE|nr:uncharacterized protein GSPATT00023376001 [Paramecium tetraurelia]CAK90201.1 unnamed protein product [Paramecium tetraurelia]|eukprot:XP_001457598.1 hypothetical protein (macronuclear) [Paramecium tetraurelia strain d4-2]
MYFEQECRKFLRPLRLEYQMFDMGPERLSLANGTLFKHEISVINCQGHQLKCSFFEINPQSDCCIIYCHGFNGCQVEGVKYAHVAAQYNLNFCTFDFQGCGQSQGDLITFGYLEQNDITCIILDIKKRFQQNQFILWGRSLGATTIQLKKQPYVIGYVLDSCFTDLNKACVSMIQKSTSLPKLIIKSALYLLKGKIESQGNFKFEDIKIQRADSSVPTLFICSDQDTLIKSKNTIGLFQQHNGLRDLIKIQGEHNDSRSLQLINQICCWCKERFQFNFQQSCQESSPGEIRKKYQHLAGRSSLVHTPSDIISKYEQSRQYVNHCQNQSTSVLKYNNQYVIQTKKLYYQEYPQKIVGQQFKILQQRMSSEIGNSINFIHKPIFD